MATIRASWRRTVQVKPYESEVLELGVETEPLTESDGSDITAEALVKAVADLDRTLAAAGDALILERLNLRVTESTPGVEEPEKGPVVRRPGVYPDPSPKSEILPMVKVEAPADSEEPDEYMFSK